MADRFDLDAIDADDALLDLLAAGGEPALSAGEHDPALQLLAELRLAVEVEDELPVETIDDPESFLARCAALNPMTDPFARKMAARGMALGVAAVAALSVSGVAAAVNGDPLSPYEKVIENLVDAVRPQTSLPKEQLDGLPVMDKTKIIKVGKDFRDKQGQDQTTADDQGTVGTPEQPDPPAAVVQPVTPDVLQRAMITEQPTATLVPTAPDTTGTPNPTSNAPVTNTRTDSPTSTTTEPPAATPTDPASTPPATTPPTDPSTPPSTPASDPNAPTDGPGKGNANGQSKDPSGAPSTDTGSAQGSGTTQSGSDTTTSTGTTGTTDPAPTSTPDNPLGMPPIAVTPPSAATPPAADTPVVDTPVVDTPSTDAPSNAAPAADTSSTDNQSSDNQSTGAADPTDQVDKVLNPVLPTPDGQQAQDQGAKKYFGESTHHGKSEKAGKHSTGKKATEKSAAKKSHGKHIAGKQSAGKSHGKHSTGKLHTGSVKENYAKGKHSTGDYAEGKHAAIDRAHGSTDDGDILKILHVVNKPTK